MWSTIPASGGIRWTPARLRRERVSEGAGDAGLPSCDWLVAGTGLRQRRWGGLGWVARRRPHEALLRRIGGSARPTRGRASSRGRGEGLKVLSRHWIGAGQRAHWGSTHGRAVAGSASREAGSWKTFIVAQGGGGKDASLCAKAARSRHGMPTRAACAAEYCDVASGGRRGVGNTRGAPRVGKTRRWSAAQPSCVRRVAPVGPRHPCRAHDVGPRWQRTAWRVGVARLGRERRAPTKHFE
jgi:hypothetical protein